MLTSLTDFGKLNFQRRLPTILIVPAVDFNRLSSLKIINSPPSGLTISIFDCEIELILILSFGLCPRYLVLLKRMIG